MQLGIGTYTFPWAIGVPGFRPANPLTAVDLLEIAAQQHIGFVQFGDNFPLHQVTATGHRELKKLAGENGIQIEVGTRGLTLENSTTYLAIARLMKAPFLRVVIDDGVYEPEEGRVVEIIKTLLPQLQDSKVQLAIENHDRFGTQTLKRIVESTDPQWVGICLDTANSFGAGEGIAEVVAHLAPYTINLHIKDFSIRRVPHKMGFEIHGCPAGAGMLPIPWLLAEINKWNRCQTATLEVWSDPESTLEATLQKEREWVAQSLAYLKTILT
jgi:3-oxoisoapionate decarboxylase